MVSTISLAESVDSQARVSVLLTGHLLDRNEDQQQSYRKSGTLSF